MPKKKYRSKKKKRQVRLMICLYLTCIIAMGMIAWCLIRMKEETVHQEMIADNNSEQVELDIEEPVKQGVMMRLQRRTQNHII